MTRRLHLSWLAPKLAVLFFVTFAIGSGIRGQPADAWASAESNGFVRTHERDVSIGRWNALSSTAESATTPDAAATTVASSGPRRRLGWYDYEAPEAVYDEPLPPGAGAVRILTSVAESSFAGTSDPTASPSDGSLAVGPNHLLQAVNSRVAAFTKTGARLMDIPTATLLRLSSAAFLTDPRVLYDFYSDRWFLAVIGNDAGRRAGTSAYYAYSTSGNPAGEYCWWKVDLTRDSRGNPDVMEGDFPGVGMDDYAFYVTFTRFFAGTLSPSDVLFQMIPRTQLASCAAIDPTAWQGLSRFPDGGPARSVQPAITYGNPGVEYLLTDEAGGGSYLGVFRITGQRASPTLSALQPIAVSPYAVPPPALQRGSSALLDLGDSRLPASTIYRNGYLYAAHNARSSISNGSSVRWYEISAASAAISRQGGIAIGGGSDGYAFPAVTVDAAGNLGIVMALVGPTYYPSTVVGTRSATEANFDVLFLAEGLSAFQDNRTPSRWGDYFGIALDPDGRRFWAEGTYATATATWSTRIGAFASLAAGVAPSPLPVVTPSPLPSPSATPPPGATGPASTPQPVAATPVGAPGGIETTTPRAAQTCMATAAPTAVQYLPNITKNLGGPTGWNTPLYVQNLGVANTTIEVALYGFAAGDLALCETLGPIQPGRSAAFAPNQEPQLRDGQFSGVVRSYGSQIAIVVDQVQGSDVRTQALTYTGITSGSRRVYVPNVTRRFFGYDVPLIVQNLGTQLATVTARFISFDATKSALITLRVAPGRSGVIDPDFTDGLADGTQYAVTIDADQPVGVVANAHNESGQPVAFSHVGLGSGANTLYAPYTAKQGPGGIYTPVVIQNVSAGATDVTLRFEPLPGSPGAIQQFTLPGLRPGASIAFDPRFALGTSTPCASPTQSCLGPGEYSLGITATGAVAALVLPVTDATADAYVALPALGTRGFAPVALRGLAGWDTTLYLYSVTPTTLVFHWFEVDSGKEIASYPLSVPAGTTVNRAAQVNGLGAGTRYGVVVESRAGATIALAARHARAGGDGSMFYAGFVLP